MIWQHWVNFVLGLWLIVSQYVGMSATGMVTNGVIVGIVIAVLALWGALQGQTYVEEHRHSHA